MVDANLIQKEELSSCYHLMGQRSVQAKFLHFCLQNWVEIKALVFYRASMLILSIRKVLYLLSSSISDGQHVPACSVAGPQGIQWLLGNASAHVAQQKCTYAVAVCQRLQGASLDQLVLRLWLDCQIPRNHREKQWTASNNAGRAKPQDSKQKLCSYLVYNLSCLFPCDIKGKKVVSR